jgi:hypothetical protein
MSLLGHSGVIKLECLIRALLATRRGWRVRITPEVAESRRLLTALLRLYRPLAAASVAPGSAHLLGRIR